MKKFNKYSKMIALVVALAAIMFACVEDDFDTPPIALKPIGEILTIQEVKDIYYDYATYNALVEEDAYIFALDASVYATVTMDNETDNSYKFFYIQDNTGGLPVRQDVSGGMYIGDSVRVYLKDLVIMKYNGTVFQLNNMNNLGVNSDTSVVKQGVNNKRAPEEATIAEIMASNESQEYYYGRLVKLVDVQFISTDTAETFAYPSTLTDESRMLQDTANNQLIVRTSGYATFAGASVPVGSGSIIGVIGKYNDNLQLVIRKLSEVEMGNERFDVTGSGGGGGGGGPVDPVTSFTADFEEFVEYDDIEIEGWQNEIEAGDRAWHAKVYDDNAYAQLNAYNSTDPENIGWLITPPIDFDVNSNEVLSFRSAVAFYTHESFELLISLDYDGENYLTATWTPLSATIAGSGDSDYAWVSSGDIDLSSYTGVGYVAFKYTGDADQSETGTFVIDDVVLEDKP